MAQDLRSWLEFLEAQGELRRITTPVDWDREIGAVTRVNMTLFGPALLFENIKGYEGSYCRRYLTGGLATKERLALLLGFSRDAAGKEITLRLKDLFNQGIKPEMVQNGPIKEHVLKGEAVNLHELPVPRFQARDGGRYIDTFCLTITKDPDTGEPNVGIYRGMLAGPRQIVKLIVASQHWGRHFSKYRERRQPMPVAVVYGLHDAFHLAAGTPLVHRGKSEWDIIGALLGEPVRLVKAETVDLEVPAEAEIVVEGTIDPDPSSFALEGPFGEFTGYFGGSSSPKPVIKVECLTYRTGPIFRGMLEGARPGMPNENSCLMPFTNAAVAWNALEDAGVPGVKDIHIPPISCGTNIIVQIHPTYRGQAKHVAAALWGTKAAEWFYKNVMVVEEDIDIRNPDDLEWAVAFRVNAGEGDVVIYGPTQGSLLDPSTRSEERDALTYGSGKWHRMLIDATRNMDFPRRPYWNNQTYPPLNLLEAEDERLVAARWEEYGIGIPYLTAEQRKKLTMEHLRGIIPAIG